jgi:nucleoside 2-deoxyribosyltransferase
MTPQKRSVYLAGPISGLNQEDASYGWRKELKGMLFEHIEAYSPMRATEYLKDKGILDSSYVNSSYMDTDAAINCRDRNDVLMCDAMVACFLEAAEGYVSKGTCMEFGWADAYRKPIVLVAKEGDTHLGHPMLRGAAGYIVDNLEDAAEAINWLLTPGI